MTNFSQFNCVLCNTLLHTCKYPDFFRLSSQFCIDVQISREHSQTSTFSKLKLNIYIFEDTKNEVSPIILLARAPVSKRTQNGLKKRKKKEKDAFRNESREGEGRHVSVECIHSHRHPKERYHARLAAIPKGGKEREEASRIRVTA